MNVKSSSTDTEQMLTSQQVADILGVSSSYVWKLYEQGRLAGERIGPPRRGILLYRPEDVETFRQEWRQRRPANTVDDPDPEPASSDIFDDI